MSRACVILAPGFEEIEAVTLIDVLRRAGIDTAVLGLGGKGPVQGSHGITIDAERSLSDAERDSWDIVILPGGMPGATNLRDDPRVIGLIRRQHESGKRIGAICAAPIALGAAGVLEGRKATSYPGFEKELRGATVSTERVVKDGNVLTSRGPGTALEFALAVVADLEGKAAADKLRSGMLVAS
jgi:4-methyl-5(b-hydroxyethyl)-thiazole monophosphate biosynthesis